MRLFVLDVQGRFMPMGDEAVPFCTWSRSMRWGLGSVVGHSIRLSYHCGDNIAFRSQAQTHRCVPVKFVPGDARLCSLHKV